jgi:pimeloyl-ACP methyl ester carboxylesterase
MSARSVPIPITYEPWKDIPCMYIFTELDQGVPLAAQQGMVAQMGDITTVSLKTGHSPFLSQPEGVIKAIEQAVAEGVEKAKD